MELKQCAISSMQFDYDNSFQYYNTHFIYLMLPAFGMKRANTSQHTRNACIMLTANSF